MSRIVILAGGDPPPAEFVRARAAGARRLLAADGGLRLALAAGLVPHVLVGDLDSALPADLERLPSLGVEVERHPAAKDASDLELALERAAREGATEVQILGGLGGRLDHLLFNVLGLLGRAADMGIAASLTHPGTEVFLAGPGGHEIAGRVGWNCSLLPEGESARLALGGFRYGLDSEALRRASTRGLSNVVEADPARLDVEEGRVLVVLSAP